MRASTAIHVGTPVAQDARTRPGGARPREAARAGLRLDRRLRSADPGRRGREHGQAQPLPQRLLEHLVHVLDEDEPELLADVGRDLVQVLLVVLGEDDRLDPRPVPGDHLLLDPADRQHLARSVISPVIATSFRTGRPVSAEASAVAIVMPADGPSFGTAPAGTCTCTSYRDTNVSSTPSRRARART